MMQPHRMTQLKCFLIMAATSCIEIIIIIIIVTQTHVGTSTCFTFLDDSSCIFLSKMLPICNGFKGWIFYLFKKIFIDEHKINFTKLIKVKVIKNEHMAAKWRIYRYYKL